MPGANTGILLVFAEILLTLALGADSSTGPIVVPPMPAPSATVVATRRMRSALASAERLRAQAAESRADSKRLLSPEKKGLFTADRNPKIVGATGRTANSDAERQARLTRDDEGRANVLWMEAERLEKLAAEQDEIAEIQRKRLEEMTK